MKQRLKQTAKITIVVRKELERSGQTLRAAGKASGISPATLSRLKRGLFAKSPVLGTIEKVGHWLGQPIGELLSDISKPNTPTASKLINLSTPEMVEVQLFSDKKLKRDEAEALSQMFKVLYEKTTKS